MNDPVVVVGVDGTGHSLKALLWAARRASLHGAPLRIVHVLPAYEADFPFFAPGRYEWAEEAGRRIMDEATSLVGQAYPDVDLATEMPHGTPAKALLAESEQAHAVVIGAKGEDVGNLLLGSTTLQVVGHAACPVVVVNQVTTGHRLVVAGTDCSPDSTAALAFAFGAADLSGSKLQVVSAVGLPQGWPRHLPRPLPEDDEDVDRRRDEVEQQIAPMREQHPDVEVELDVHHVNAWPALASASHRADLLVVGSRGRGGFHGLAVGSTTHRLLHVAGCPVAVVREQQHQ